MSKHCNYQHVICLAAMCLWNTAVKAEDVAIAPDRPGLATGTHTVSPGIVYLEMGYQYGFNRSGEDSATHTLPQLVLRTGLTNNMELDIIWDGWNQDHARGSQAERSIADVTIGGKYRLHQSDAYNLTLMGLLSLPVGEEPSTSDEVEPLLGLLWDYNLTDSAQLFGVIQANWLETEESKSYTEAQLALGVGFGHTDKLSSFIEYYGAFPSEAGLPEEHIINGGLVYLVNNDLQLDISTGAGLNDDTGHFVSFGVAMRF